MGRPQAAELRRWLLEQKNVHDLAGRPVRPKFVVSPVWLLPRRLGSPGAADGVERCDAWEAYPDSMRGLLGFIAEHSIRGVVFLSGDAHVGGLAVARIPAAGRPVTAVCINAPPLYAPFAFANGRSTDYLDRDRIDLDGGEVRVRAKLLAIGDGLVRIGAARDGGHWTVTAEFDGQRGRQAFHFKVR
jgi:cholesterol oxidase